MDKFKEGSLKCSSHNYIAVFELSQLDCNKNHWDEIMGT